MGERTLLPDTGEVILDRLRVEGRNRLVMVLRPASGASNCPSCGRISRRVHSHYQRRLSDLPWEGVPLRIDLSVRRFFCDNDACGQRIYTERLPKTAGCYCRRTCRAAAALEHITLALGGAAGSRLAKELGILASGPTMLRQLRRKIVANAPRAPRVLGIDDWAWRKRHRYGTILCDLKRGKVVDLLPDRSAASTEQWLRAHPGVEIVSRDRASLYAEAATKAVPQAVQVADRWHLLHNLSEALTGALSPHHHLMAAVARAVAGKPEPAAAEVAQQSKDLVLPSPKQRLQKNNRERRLARYEAVMEQMRQGASQREAARRCGLGRRTVRRWLAAAGFPERKPGGHRTAVDPYGQYLEQRWQQGCHNAAQLWRELRERGFVGQSRTMRDWIRKHFGSRKQRNGKQPIVATAFRRASPRQTAWLLLKQPADAQLYLEELCHRSSEISSCASLGREFCRIIRQRDASAWAQWREAAAASPLANFAKHLCRDEAALLSALTLPWSNGPVEGQVHRLKLIKRSMYGRASFDLLRLRVLNAV